MTERTRSTVIEIPSSDAPLVSIAILTVRDPIQLDRCLRSLCTLADDAVPFSVSLVLNDASVDVVDFVRHQVRGADVIESSVNLGVAGGFNRVFNVTSSPYVVTIHDDSIVERGWLAALTKSIDEMPHAGVVGSCVLDFDGFVQDPGWVIWRDGTTTPPWSGPPPTLDQFHATRREVDYHGSVGLMIRRQAWELVGGFDDGYHPAYYVDVDFCVRLRRAGWGVVYEPTSRISHARDSSSDSTYVRFLVDRHRQRFLELHGDEIAHHGSPELENPAAVAREVERAASLTVGRPPKDDHAAPTSLLASRVGRTDEAYLRKEAASWRAFAAWLLLRGVRSSDVADTWPDGWVGPNGAFLLRDNGADAIEIIGSVPGSDGVFAPQVLEVHADAHLVDRIELPAGEFRLVYPLPAQSGAADPFDGALRPQAGHEWQLDVRALHQIRLSDLGAEDGPLADRRSVSWLARAVRTVRYDEVGLPSFVGRFADGWAAPVLTCFLTRSDLALRIVGSVPNERAALVSGQQLRVTIDDEVVDEREIGGGTFEFVISEARLRRPAKLRIVASNWFVPAEHHLGRDLRRLSYLLDSVGVLEGNVDVRD